MVSEEMAKLGKEWKWVLAAGVIFVLIGVLALNMPVASTVGVTLMLAGLLLAGGVLHLIQAIKLRHKTGNATRFVQAVLALVAGAMIFRYPGGGMLAVAMALSFYFFIGAAAQWILASALMPHEGYGWGIASSIISFFLGVYIVMTFPFSALWVPGMLLGIDLIFSGCAMVGVALSARRMHAESGAQPGRPLRPSTSTT